MRLATAVLALGLPVLWASTAQATPGERSARRAAKFGKSKDSKPAQAEVIKDGKILVVRGLRGGEPQLTADDGQRWILVGLLREELLRLDGHRLKIWAVPAEKKLLMPTLDVARYEMLDAGGGRKPVVGVLRKTGSGTLGLERPEGELEIKGSQPFLKAMEKHLGCKVWVVGDLEGKEVKAFKFGWIECKQAKPIKAGKEINK